MGRKRKRLEREIVVKPVWWRQTAFTLFLFLMAFSSAAYEFEVKLLDYGCVVVIGMVALFSLFDQVFEWSRLHIDDKGYSLRGWFRRVELRRDEVEDFVLREYMNRQLILVLLTEQAARERSLEDRQLPFPCAFGHPVDEVFQTLRKSMKGR